MGEDGGKGAEEEAEFAVVVAKMGEENGCCCRG